MSRVDLICLGVFILGFLLFLYAANTYNAIIGFTGLYMWFGAIIAYLLIYVYKQFTKKPPEPAPAQNP